MGVVYFCLGAFVVLLYTREMSVYALFAIGILIGTIGQTMMKYQAERTELTFGLGVFKQLFTNIPLLLTFGLYFFGAILWLFIIKKLPLSVAYPALSLNYITVAIVSVFVFNEPLTMPKVFALFLIASGVAILFRYQ